MLPACQRPNFSDGCINNIIQTSATRIAKHRPLHMRRFKLAPAHFDLAVMADGTLGDVEGVPAIILREPKGDGYFVFRGDGTDLGHFRGIDVEGIFGVFG